MYDQILEQSQNSPGDLFDGFLSSFVGRAKLCWLPIKKCCAERFTLSLVGFKATGQ